MPGQEGELSWQPSPLPPYAGKVEIQLKTLKSLVSVLCEPSSWAI